jgi:hypothetical protein
MGRALTNSSLRASRSRRKTAHQGGRAFLTTSTPPQKLPSAYDPTWREYTVKDANTHMEGGPCKAHEDPEDNLTPLVNNNEL